MRSWRHPDPEFDHSLYSAQERGEVLAYKTPYEALSYTWGNPRVTSEAYIQGTSGDVIPIQITTNLVSALKHVRLAHQIRTLWVDALSINQADIPERNAQVQRMKDIYKHATSVVVWLGEAADGSDRAFRAIEYFSQQIEITRQNTIGEAPEAEEPTWWNPRMLIPWDNETWMSLAAVLRRP